MDPDPGGSKHMDPRDPDPDTVTVYSIERCQILECTFVTKSCNAKMLIT
jgi:hypothetical protein